jgi:hypothetical protein
VPSGPGGGRLDRGVPRCAIPRKERLPLRDQTDTAQSTNDGLPRAPNVSGLPECSGKHTCLGFGSVPPPMYYFDITALPPPPPGSDADRIAKGEIRAP